MKCNACGMEMTAGAKFCPACGAAVAPDPLPSASKPASPVRNGLIGAGIAAVVMGGGGYFYYAQQQQEKVRVDTERVAEEKRQIDIAERDKKLAEERAAREREANARRGAENQARVLAQEKAEAEARAKLAEEQARRASAAAAPKAIPPAPAPPAPPPRQAAGLTTERSAPLLRAMVSAAIASDEGGVQRYRRDIEALPKPTAGNRAASTSATQTGNAALKRGDSQNAVAQHQYAVSMDATNVSAHSGLARVYSRLGRYAEADVAFTHALTLAPANPSLWTGLGESMAHGGNANNAAGALINSYVFAADRRRSYEHLQHLANSRDGNMSAAARRALQSRMVADAR